MRRHVLWVKTKGRIRTEDINVIIHTSDGVWEVEDESNIRSLGTGGTSQGRLLRRLAPQAGPTVMSTVRYLMQVYIMYNVVVAGSLNPFFHKLNKLKTADNR